MKRPSGKAVAIATAIAAIGILVALSTLVPTMMAPRPPSEVLPSLAEQELTHFYHLISYFRSDNNGRFPESFEELIAKTSYVKGRTEKAKLLLSERLEYLVQAGIAPDSKDTIARYQIEDVELVLLADGTILKVGE